MKSDQEKLLQERAAALRKKLQSNPADKDKVQEELEGVEEKLKKHVSYLLLYLYINNYILVLSVYCLSMYCYNVLMMLLISSH